MEQYFLGDTVPRRPCLQPDTGEALAKERNGETTRSQLWLLRLGPWNHTHFCWCWAPCKFHQIPSNCTFGYFWDVFGFIHPLSGFIGDRGFPFYPLTRSAAKKLWAAASFASPVLPANNDTAQPDLAFSKSRDSPLLCDLAARLKHVLFPAFPPCRACSCAIFSAHSSGSACIALPAELLAFVDVLLHDTSL